MMKKLTYLLVAALVAVSCSLVVSDPYGGSLNSLKIAVVFPEGYEDFMHEGIVAKAEDINLGNKYEFLLDGNGCAEVSLPNGLFRISVSDRNGLDIFNATVDRFSFSGSSSELSLNLKHTKAGSIIIKEIYCGGCRKDPQEGTYQADKYVIVHNNDVEVQYLDSLSIGYILPYNATATNQFLKYDADGNTIYPDYAPIADAVWQIQGDGTKFPLQPGEDAVIVINGAIDHAATYPLSVNLNKKEYFVTYNLNFFPNVMYHPVPGNNIQSDHILNCLTKLGIGNALAFSMNSPAVVLYKAKGVALDEFLQKDGSVIDVPNSQGAKVLACPLDWVLDAVEVFNGASSSNSKRFPDVLDAGAVYLSNTNCGYTLMRNTDEELTAESGYEVLKDTNNSSEDFYEREKQSLHE